MLKTWADGDAVFLGLNDSAIENSLLHTADNWKYTQLC